MRAVVFAVGLASACSRSAAPPKPAARATYAACKSSLSADRLAEAEGCFSSLVDAAATPGEDPAQRANVLFALASIRQERNDPKGSVAFASRAAALRPDDAEAQSTFAGLAHDAGDRKAEAAALQSLIRLDPDALDRRLQLGGVLAASALGEEAKTQFLGYEDARVRLLGVLGRDPDAARRRAAARRLAAAIDAGTARALVLAMTDRDAGVRAAAVESVASVGLDLDPEIKPALKKLAELEKDTDVKAALERALTSVK